MMYHFFKMTSTLSHFVAHMGSVGCTSLFKMTSTEGLIDTCPVLVGCTSLFKMTSTIKHTINHCDLLDVPHFSR